MGATLWPPKVAAERIYELAKRGRDLQSRGAPKVERGAYEVAADSAMASAFGQTSMEYATARAALVPDNLSMEFASDQYYVEKLATHVGMLEEYATVLEQRATDESNSAPRPAGAYDAAQVCLNGHAVNSSLKRNPGLSSKHCSRCGAPTITQCRHCGAAIRGAYVAARSVERPYVPPSFCHECGSRHPWTEAAIAAAIELIELTPAGSAEKDALKQDLPELASDSPRTQVAATRWNRFLRGAGKEVADSVRKVLVDVVSETAKKALFP